MVYMIEYKFEYRNEFHASSRFAFFLCMGMWTSMRLNIDLNVEMNFMPAADSHFFMYGHVDVYEIEYRCEYRNEYHAESAAGMKFISIFKSVLNLIDFHLPIH